MNLNQIWRRDLDSETGCWEECTGHLCSRISVTGWRISDIRVNLNSIRLSGINYFSAVLSYEKKINFYKFFLTSLKLVLN